MVNGEPITLDMVMAVHQTAMFPAALSFPVSPASLYSEYGALLTELVAQKLVEQELEAHGLSITSEDVDVRRHLYEMIIKMTPYQKRALMPFLKLCFWKRG